MVPPARLPPAHQASAWQRSCGASWRSRGASRAPARERHRPRLRMEACHRRPTSSRATCWAGGWPGQPPPPALSTGPAPGRACACRPRCRAAPRGRHGRGPKALPAQQAPQPPPKQSPLRHPLWRRSQLSCSCAARRPSTCRRQLPSKAVSASACPSSAPTPHPTALARRQLPPPAPTAAAPLQGPPGGCTPMGAALTRPCGLAATRQQRERRRGRPVCPTLAARRMRPSCGGACWRACAAPATRGACRACCRQR